MTEHAEVEVPRELVGQFAMYMQRRDAFEQGVVVDGVARPSWDELGEEGHTAYMRDAIAYVGALVQMGLRPETPATAHPDEREALRGVLTNVLSNATNYPDRVQLRLLGQDMGPLTERVTDAILARFRLSPVAADPEDGN